MTAAPKREWVFDGTREEFLLFLFMAIVFLAFAIVAPVGYLHGYFPEVKVNWSTWFALIVFFWFIFAWNSLGRLFSLAFAIWCLEKGVQLLIGYGKWSWPYAPVVLVLLGYARTLLFLTALVTFLATHLKRESPKDETTDSES